MSPELMLASYIFGLGVVLIGLGAAAFLAVVNSSGDGSPMDVPGDQWERENL